MSIPGAYLRQLLQKAKAGQGSPLPAPQGTSRTPAVAAPQSQNPYASGDQIAQQLDGLTSKYQISPYQALAAGIGRMGDPSQMSYWYTYGQGPERQFFNNNTTPQAPGATPPAVAPAPAPGPGIAPPNPLHGGVIPSPGVGPTGPLPGGGLPLNIPGQAPTNGRMYIPKDPSRAMAMARGGQIQHPLALLRRLR